MPRTKPQIRVVITGGPCSGKTTTFNELKKLCKERGIDAGFVEEAARDILKASMAKNSRCLPWKDFRWFQLRLFRMQNKRERAPKNRLVFMDRSKIDGIAYYWVDSANPHPVVSKSVKKNKYDLVFFLERLPYKKDDQRVEDETKAEKITRLVLEAYKRFGYKVVEVPLASPERRAEIILKKSLELLEKKQSE